MTRLTSWQCFVLGIFPDLHKVKDYGMFPRIGWIGTRWNRNAIPMYEPNETIPISPNSSTQTHTYTDTETSPNRIYFLYPTACSVSHRRLSAGQIHSLLAKKANHVLWQWWLFQVSQAGKRMKALLWQWFANRLSLTCHAAYKACRSLE